MGLVKPLLIGVGNPAAGDDAAGRLVAAMIKEALAGVDVVEATGEATLLLDLFRGRDWVIIVDACYSGAPAGHLHCFDVRKSPLPASLHSVSSHGLGLVEAIELARALGELPRKCIVHAIEGQCFDIGQEISAPVLAGVARLAAVIRTEVERDCRRGQV